MTPDLARALEAALEIELETTGRRTGRAHRATVWFAPVGDVLWLRTDRSSDWYRNLVADPRCLVRVGKLHIRALREPVDDEPTALRDLIERWRAKYGQEWVADWYVERGRIPVRVRLLGPK
ncbi:MAG TPA: nitroreductase/quinone reductase family protein [Candidatus Limnocylindrales bacterium]|nr:nitroreductase/quinone reductase family protein [Candidatus Limnocylindrales bacterium]